jgi:hypothetical protein
LPARGRVNLGKSPAELCAQIEQSIAEYGSEPTTPTPEEGLALLAAIAPDELQPTESVPQESPTPATASPRNKRNLTVVVGLLGLVIIIIALLLWEMRRNLF